MRFAFLRFFLSFLECLFLFLLLCILAMFAIHAITQIASKTEKLWSAKKHHHNFAFWCGMLCEDLSRRYTLSGDTTPQSFRLVKQAENPAPLTQGSRVCAQFASQSTGEPSSRSVRLVRYSAFRIPHSAFCIPHSAFRIICSKLRCCRREAPCRWRLRAGRFPLRKRCRRISSY